MSLLPVEEAKKRILEDVEPLGSDTKPLRHAAGRILAAPLSARRDQPPFAASAMDGYAVIGADVKTAPVEIAVIGEAPAGSAFEGTVESGQAVRIFTGAPLPDGADTIVIQENTVRNDNLVTIREAAKTGQFVREAGLDFASGDIVLEDGAELNARNLGLCAAMNYASVPVRSRPRVAILSTGDELVEPGGNPRDDQIISSNSVALAAAVEAFGGKAVDLGLVRDDQRAIENAIYDASEADILVTIGGASVGDHDLVQPAFKRLGIDLDFWKIAMRPGKPLMFAKRRSQRILGLPGNPVSSLICARVFLKPLIEKMLGTQKTDVTGMAKLTQPLAANDVRQDYLRARLCRDANGDLAITPYSRQDSSMQRTLAMAEALIIRPAFAEPVDSGAQVSFMPIDF